MSRFTGVVFGWSLALSSSVAGCGGGESHDAGADATVADGSALDPDTGIDAGRDAATDRCADVLCTPSSVCRTSTCDPATGDCVEADADGVACDDGDACTLGDACAGGTCGGTPVVCEASDGCHVAGTCDPGTGVCSDPLAEDGTPCPCGECAAGACGTTTLGGTATHAGSPVSVSLAVDEVRLYFGNSYGGLAGEASVASMPVAGGTATALASGFTAYPAVAVVGDTLYYARGADVWSVAADGSGTPSLLHSSATLTFGSIVSDGARLYLTTGAGSVVSMAFSGGPPIELAAGEATPERIATDGARLYWVNAGDARIRGMDVTGGEVATHATGLAPVGLAIDATHVYWTEMAAGAVMRAPLAGGAPEMLADEQLDPFAILVVDGRIYWTSYNGGLDGPIMSRPVAGGTPEVVPGVRPLAGTVLRHNSQCIYVLSQVGAVLSTPRR